MTTLHMDSEATRHLATNLRTLASDIEGQARSVQYAVNNLDWISSSRDLFNSDAQRTLQAIKQIADQMDALSNRLELEVSEWEDIAHRCAASYISTRLHISPVLYPPSLIAAGGAALAWWSSANLLSVPIFGSDLNSLIDHLPDWLLRLLGLSRPQPAIPPRVRETPQRSAFGELMEQDERERAQANASPTTGALAQKEQAAPEGWWHDVDPQSQGNLTYQAGKKTVYGCVPTSAAMVMDYWHTQNPASATADAQTLLNDNIADGASKTDFASSGMPADKILDEAHDLGYGTTFPVFYGDLERLSEAVKQGPVIANVRLNMSTGSNSHAVVVTGVSADGSQVRVNDPWTGKADTYSWDRFSASWGSIRDKGGKPMNFFAVIRP